MKKFNEISKVENIDNAYSGTNFENIFYLKLKSPLEVQIELTAGCNQQCIFCYNVWKEGCTRKKMEENLSKEQHFEIIDKIIENDVFDVIFSGGEPLLIDYLEELIKKLRNNNVGSMIITNGILLTLERAYSLKNAGLESLQISLHHHSEEIHNKMVGNKNAYNQTIEGIKNCLKIFGAEKININMVALPSTYNDVYTMASFLNSIGIKSLSIGSPSVTGDMANNVKENVVINKKIFLNIYEQLKKAEKDFDMNVSFTGGFPLCILPNIEKDTKMISNYCDAGLNQLVIGPEGDIRPCVCIGESVGNILQDELDEIWKSNQFLLNLRELKYSPKECIECKYLAICRGGCRASAQGYFGKLNSIDPLMK